MDEKEIGKEFEEWFRPQDPEPRRSLLDERPGVVLPTDYTQWKMRYFSAKLAYLAACRKREEAWQSKWEQLRSDMMTDRNCGRPHANRVLILMDELEAK